MKRNFRRMCSILLSAALLISAASMTALAAPPGGGPGGEGGPGGPGGPGGAPGGSSEPLELTGMLALEQYVFVDSQNEIQNGALSTRCYGVYAEGGEGQAAYVPEDFSGSIAVYADSEMTQPAGGVTAAISDGVLTVSGVAAEGNVAYYLSTGPDAYPTTLYVVNDEYDANGATLTLADGTTVELTTYAPNMAGGSYTATVDAANASGSVYIGGNRTVRTAADYGITGKDAAAVNWFLSSGITNAGDSLSEFGDVMYGFEYAMAIYRMFQIVCDQITFAADFVDASDYTGAMFSNDQYSDAVSATMQAGIWNGIYTKMSDTRDKGDGFYLLTNVDAATRMLGTGAAVDVEFAYVGLYNAFASCWTMYNSDGQALAADLSAAAAAYDGAAVTAPADYTNQAKIYAVAREVLGLSDTDARAVSGGTAMSKVDVVSLLYAVSGCIKSKESPDSAWAEQTGSAYSDMTRFFQSPYAGTTILTGRDTSLPASLVSTEGAALLVNNLTTPLTILNRTISLVGNADKAANAIMGETDPNTTRDGAEAGTEGDGFVYNASARNAFYRDAVGSAMAVWGKTSVVNLRSDNGSLVIDGEATGSSYPAGTMAGAVYVGFGGALNIANAVAYSSEQHLTNLLYNGTVHYVDAAAFGSGRVFSSDFWGGYQVFEDSIAEGGSVTDEPTTLIVKNGVYGNSVGGNGFASQYFENSILNVGTASFQNTTSLITDTGAFTLVNSQMNNSGSAFVSSSKGERVVATLVDSDVSMPGGNVLAQVDNYTTVNNISTGSVAPGNLEAYQSRFNGEAAIYLYGDNTIATSDGTLTAAVADGAKLTIYGDVRNAAGEEITIPGATIVREGYGTLTVTRAEQEIAFDDVDSNAWYADAVAFVVGEGLFTGTSDTTFAPATSMSRSMMATVLYRLAGQPAVTNQADFTDVVAGAWYADAAAWASANSIINGYGNGLFGTNDNVSRQEIATMLYRYASTDGQDVSASADLSAFTDGASTADWAQTAMEWAVAEGLIEGNGGLLNPTSLATRAEVATILMRFCQL